MSNTGAETSSNAAEKTPKKKGTGKRQRTDPAPPQVPNQEIAFVNLTDSSGPTQDAEKRKLVRAHVMRGYQRQKQAEEESKYGQNQQIRQRDNVSILPNYDQQYAYHDMAPNPGNEVSHPLSETDWTATLNFRPSYGEPEAGHIIGQQVDGEWIPVTEYEKDQTITTTVELLEPEYATAGLNNPYHFGMINSEIEAEFLTLPELVQEDIECPLITQSLTLRISVNNLNAGRLDPFDAMPGLKNARAQALMYHYNKVLVNTLIPVNPKDKWFNYAISDEALFHATMLHSAGHNAMLAGNNDLADPFQLKLEAIRLINQRLGDPVISTNDLTIAAVACLVLFENQSGNLEVSNIHMEGLCRMVKMRGGLDTLGLSGVLKRKVLWADVCNAMLSHKIPRFQLHPASTLIFITASNATASSSTTPTTQELTFPQPCTCAFELPSILTNLRTLSSNPPINALDGLISDALYVLERRLVVLLAYTPSIYHTPLCTSTHKPFFLAALTYIYTSLRDFPVQSPLYDTFITRLSDSLSASEWEGGDGLLLWVLGIGALAAAGREARGGFVRELSVLVRRLEIESLEEFRRGMATVVGMEMERRAYQAVEDEKRLWEEVMRERERVEVERGYF